MQKKYKKMQKYLHIAKKSSTFVADLGIVPDQTIYINRVMKERCIFRVSGGKEMCRVAVRRNEDGGFYYVVYHGRRLAPTIARWSNVWDAIRAAERQAATDMREVCANIYEV